jgi:hypothetical protein
MALWLSSEIAFDAKELKIAPMSLIYFIDE